MNLPLSIYDVLGYLASGFLILAAAEFGYDGNWLLDRDWKPGSIALYVTIAYIIGHISANLSSHFIEHKFGRGILGASEEILFMDKNANHGFWGRVFLASSSRSRQRFRSGCSKRLRPRRLLRPDAAFTFTRSRS